MKNKKVCKITAVFLSLGIMLSITGVSIASPPPASELPAEGDPIWQIFAELPRPDDSECAAAAVNAGIDSTGAAQMCADLANMPDTIYTEMTAEGMLGSGRLTTNLRDDVTDWRAVENLTFDHGDGMIQFTQPINFMSRDFMVFMGNFASYMETSQGAIDFDASLVASMKSMGAILTMRDVGDYNDPAILVDGAEDTDEVVSGLVYDRDAQTLTFTAAHFTEFEAVESSSIAPTPKITKVKARKFTSKSGKERVKLIIYGKNFKKKAKVKLGSKKAYKVKKKRDGKIIAYFSMKEINKLGKKKLKVRVINPDDKLKLFKKKLKLNQIKVLEN